MSVLLPGKPRRPRAVVHLNIADFAVAVEQQVDARLRDRPVIIAQDQTARAAVHDMSEEAYQSGVRKSMPLSHAMRRCREAVVLPPHSDRYERAMQDLFQEVRDYSPLVEPGERDGHFFIDITGTSRLFGPPVDVAWRMYRGIQKRFGLLPVWSVASSKLVSKVATRLVKPVGEYVVGEGEESDFIAPLPITLLPGIREKDQLQFADLNLFTAGEVARLGVGSLETVFGKRAGFLYDTVRGIDESPVSPAGEKPERILASRVFGGGIIGIHLAESAVYEMVEKIGATLRTRGKMARVLLITIDYSDALRCHRQLTLPRPSANDIDLFQTARQLLRMAWTRRVQVHGIILACTKATPFQSQLSLFGETRQSEQNDALIGAVDHIRQRFGSGAVRMGRTINAAL